MAETEDPVISEVHMETCPPRTTSWCTRFNFAVPEQQASSPHLDSSGCGLEDSENALREVLVVDDDGDAFLQRRPARREQYILINHSVSTPISKCGEQVWMGSCLLCDLILSHPELFQNQTVVELGAGVGLSSILAACFAQHVIVTDSSHGALQLACHNVLQNSTLLSQQPLQQQHPQQQANHTPLDPMVTQPQSKDRGKHQQQSSVHIKALDWLSLFDTQLSSLSHAEVLELLNSCCDSVACTSAHAATSTQQQSPISSSMLVQHPPTQQHAGQQAAQPQQQIYIWTQEDLHLLASAQIWLAADVVYNEMLTDAFMRTAYQLMTWQQQQAKVAAGAGGLHEKPRLFVAAEKRYNFTYRDLDARASAFEHFMTYIRPVSTDDSTAGQVLPLQMASDRQQSQQDGKAVSSKSQEWTDKPLFMGRRWSLDSLPQALQYDRSDDLELWELTPLQAS